MVKIIGAFHLYGQFMDSRLRRSIISYFFQVKGCKGMQILSKIFGTANVCKLYHKSLKKRGNSDNRTPYDSPTSSSPFSSSISTLQPSVSVSSVKCLTLLTNTFLSKSTKSKHIARSVSSLSQGLSCRRCARDPYMSLSFQTHFRMWGLTQRYFWMGSVRQRPAPWCFSTSAASHYQSGI